MITTVVSESLGTDTLSDYVQQEDYLSHRGYTELNNNFIGIASYNIFNGIYIATIFGGGFFFDLFWPARAESPSVRVAWKVCGILACFSCAATAIAMTYIVVTGHATIPAQVPPQVLAGLPKSKDAPLRYRDSGRAMASAMLLWPGLLFTIASTILLWFANNHNEVYGAEATHVREQNEKERRDLESGEAVPAGSSATEQADGLSNGTRDGTQVNGNHEPKLTHNSAPRQMNGAEQHAAQEQGAYAGT
ncbi:MAG: hypothetical protein Q9165_003023 [Trypethelium subeluteriae]